MTAPVAPVIEQIALDRLHPSPDNPRRDLGELGELAASIKELGIIEPLVVTPNGDGYVLVAGHRRHAAATKAGVGEVPCIVRPGLDDRAQAELRLVENLHRQDLAPVEEAAGYAQLVELGYSQRQLARKIGRSQAHVSRRLSLLKLPAPALAALDTGRITVEQATTLARVPATDVAKLFKRGVPASYDIERTIRTQEQEDRRAGARKELQAQGVTVLDEVPGERWRHILRPWGQLASIDVEAHAAEPCHAAVVEHHGEVAYVCTDPARHQAGGASSLQVQAEDEDESEPAAAEGLSPEERTAADERRAAWDDQRAVQEERRGRRQEAIEARRAYVRHVLDDVSADDAVELTTLLYSHCLYVEDPFDRRCAELLGLEPDTFTDARPEEQIRSYAAKGSRNRARAVVAAAAGMFEAMVTPGSYSLGAEHCPLNEEDDAAAGGVWLAWLAARGYELSDHDRELIPEPEPPAEERPADAVGWYDDPEDGPRWVDEAEADAIADEDPRRLHREPTETPDGEGSTTEAVATISVAKAGRKWKVTCSVCGEIGTNTTEAYANERGAVHLQEDHHEEASK